MEKDNIPTELTKEDIDKVGNDLLNRELQIVKCIECGNEFCETQLNIDGECDECFFSRFPKEEVIKYCKSFLE